MCTALFVYFRSKKQKEGIAIQQLDPRLETAAAFVRPGAVLADIGTDHAYLPIALLQRGIVTHAYAADVAAGPLRTAKEHLDESALKMPSLYEHIDLVLTDGLAGMDARVPRVTDIAVCGMGGELIARILADAPFVRNPDIRLILQPMTMQPHLRQWLGENGFRIEYERLCRTQNRKLYSVICCHYDGIAALYEDPALGYHICHDPENRPLLGAYITGKIAGLKRIIDGKSRAGLDCTEEQEILMRAERIADALK